MRKLLMKAGVPLVRGQSCSPVSAERHSQLPSSRATQSRRSTLPTKARYRRNAQLGLNMAYAVQYAINQANSGKSQFALFVHAQVRSQGRQARHTFADRRRGTHRQPVGHRRGGPSLLGATKAAEPTFSAHNLATVSPSATNTALATSGWRNFFRDVADDSVQGRLTPTTSSKSST